MKLSSTEQESIIALLTRIYIDIGPIEIEFKLLAGDGDFRPRIEYFHDAVRALSSQNPKEREEGGRLSVERLAYDLASLRYIEAKPLAAFRPNAEALSPETDVIALDHKLVPKPRRADRATRERLSELYQHYAVLFAALFKTIADADYRERIEDINQDVADINALNMQFDALLKQKGSAESIAAAIQHLEDDGLRHALTLFMQKQKYKTRDDVKKAIQLLKEQIKKNDKAIARIEKAHLDYVMTQLAVFEESKSVLKKLAVQGTNLVGDFVEAAIASARRELGR